MRRRGAISDLLKRLAGECISKDSASVHAVLDNLRQGTLAQGNLSASATSELIGYNHGRGYKWIVSSRQACMQSLSRLHTHSNIVPAFDRATPCRTCSSVRNFAAASSHVKPGENDFPSASSSESVSFQTISIKPQRPAGSNTVDTASRRDKKPGSRSFAALFQQPESPSGSEDSKRTTSLRAQQHTNKSNKTTHTKSQNFVDVSKPDGVSNISSKLGQPTSVELSSLILQLQALSEAEIFVLSYFKTLRARHIAQLVSRLPLLQMDGENAGPRARHLLRTTIQSLHQYTDQLKGRELAGCIWALAKLGYSPHGTITYLAASLLSSRSGIASRRVAPIWGINAREISNLGWSLATLQTLYGPSLQATPEAASNVDHSESGAALEGVKTMQQLLGTSSIAPTTENDHESQQQSAVETATSDRSQSAHRQPEDARSWLETDPGKLLWPAVVDVALSQVHNMTGEDVAQLVKSLATAGVYHEPLFHSIAQHAISMCPARSTAAAGQLTSLTSPESLSRMSPRERRLMYKQVHTAQEAADAAARAASRAVIAVTQLQAQSLQTHEAGSQATAVAGSTETRPNLQTRQQVVSGLQAVDIAWSFTSVRHRQPQLFAALVPAILHDQLSIDIEGVATLLWSYASWGFHDAGLLDFSVAKTLRAVKHVTPDLLARIMWATATLHHHDEGLWRRIPAALTRFAQQGVPIAPAPAATLLWSLAVMPELHAEVTTLQPAPAGRQQASAKFTNSLLHLTDALQHDQALSGLSTPQLLRTFWAATSLSNSSACLAHPAAQRALHSLLRDVAGELGSGSVTRSLHDVPESMLIPLHHASLLVGKAQMQTVEDDTGVDDSNVDGECPRVSDTAETGRISKLKPLRLRLTHVRREDRKSRSLTRLITDPSRVEPSAGQPDRDDASTTAATHESGAAHQQTNDQDTTGMHGYESISAAGPCGHQESSQRTVDSDLSVVFEFENYIAQQHEDSSSVASSRAIHREDGLVDISHIGSLDMFIDRQVSVQPSDSLLLRYAPAWAAPAQAAAEAAAQEHVTQRDEFLSASSDDMSLLPSSPTSSQADHAHSRPVGRDATSNVQGQGQAGKAALSGARMPVMRNSERNQLTGCILFPYPSYAWQLEVEQVLDVLQLPYKRNVLAVHGTLHVDLAIESKSGKIAFCLVGSHSLSRSVPHASLGHPKILGSLLKEDGWKVVTIPVYEWSLLYEVEEQLGYVLGRLEEQGVVVD